MKKIFVLFFLLTVATSYLNIASAESITEPQWSEFCPPLYEHVEFKQTKRNSNKNIENNYWALRKVKFQKSVLECKVYSKNSKELSACYARVANLEQNKTNKRNEAKAENMYNLQLQIQDGWY